MGILDAPAIPLVQKGSPSGVATLDGAGKIPTSQIPALAIGEVFTVASQAAMLALTAQRGDIAIRTDLVPAETFMLSADAPTVLANWVQITTPGAVTSVAGRAGAVALAVADVAGAARQPWAGKNALTGWFHADGFGMVGDGAHDDTAAIQAAIDAAAADVDIHGRGGGVVYVPTGIPLVTQLRQKSRVTLKGAGPQTRIRQLDGTNAPMLILDADTVEKVTVEDLVLDGNRNNQAGGLSHGIYFVNTAVVNTQALTESTFVDPDPRHEIRNVTLYDFDGDGVQISGRGVYHLHNVKTMWCNGRGFALLNTADGFLSDCDAGVSGRQGFYLTCSNTRFTACNAWYSGRLVPEDGNGFLVSGPRNEFSACQAQDNRRHGWALSGANYNTFSACGADSNNFVQSPGGSHGIPDTSATVLNAAGWWIGGSHHNIIDGYSIDRGAAPADYTQHYGIEFGADAVSNQIHMVIRGFVTAPVNQLAGGEQNTLVINNQDGWQTVPAAAAFTPNVYEGGTMKMVLDRNVTVAAPFTTHIGCEATFVFVQDGTGGRTVTWNAIFQFAPGAAFAPSTAPGERHTVTFRFDGTHWVEIARTGDSAEATTRAAADATEAAARIAGDALAIPLTQRGTANGVATLDGSGLIPTSQIPALALGTFVVVASQAAMLALTAAQVQPGDLAIRSDGAGTFILGGTDPSVLANWTRLNAPTDLVTSVNGQVGTVALGYADVGAASTTDPRLSDTRTPTDGSVTPAKLSFDVATQAELDAAIAAEVTRANGAYPAKGTALVYRGAWAAATAYVTNDLVSQAGGYWRRTSDGTSGTVFSPTSWEPLGEPFIGDYGDLLTSGEETITRTLALSNASMGAAGNVALQHFTARKTEVVTQMRVRCGSTAATGATLVKFVVYEEDPATGDLTLVASTASDTALLSAASTEYTKAFSASFTKTKGKRYAAGVIVVGATVMPTLSGNGILSGTVYARAPRLGGLRTGQTDAPASISAAALSNPVGMYYFEILP